MLATRESSSKIQLSYIWNKRLDYDRQRNYSSPAWMSAYTVSGIIRPHDNERPKARSDPRYVFPGIIPSLHNLGCRTRGRKRAHILLPRADDLSLGACLTIGLLGRYVNNRVLLRKRRHVIRLHLQLHDRSRGAAVLLHTHRHSDKFTSSVLLALRF